MRESEGLDNYELGKTENLTNPLGGLNKAEIDGWVSKGRFSEENFALTLRS